jgi:hypothetical protein
LSLRSKAETEVPEVAGEFLPRVLYGIIADMPVVGMEFFQFAREFVNAPSPKR